MKKILVVEDDKFLSGAYRIKLVKLGFEVQLASDGDDALAHLQTFTPDLILMDLIMPGKDGFSTLIRLRSDPRWKTIPVIVASNLGQQEDIDKSMALGATDFIVKSDTSLEQVANKINAILQPPQASEQSAWRDASQPSAPPSAPPPSLGNPQSNTLASSQISQQSTSQVSPQSNAQAPAQPQPQSPSQVPPQAPPQVQQPLSTQPAQQPQQPSQPQQSPQSMQPQQVQQNPQAIQGKEQNVR